MNRLRLQNLAEDVEFWLDLLRDWEVPPEFDEEVVRATEDQLEIFLETLTNYLEETR